MKCPYCASEESKVVDKRETGELVITRRRRECLTCKKRFTTYERVEAVDLAVVKKDGRREGYDRAKLQNSMTKALEKRPVEQAQIEKAVDEIESELRKAEKPEVTTKQIGELVMRRLKELDKVAYIRYASIYKEFTDVTSFEAELKKLAEERERLNVKPKLHYVVKRDGAVIKFDKNRIIKAIWKAAESVGGTDKEIAEGLADKVVEALEGRFNDKNPPQVEQIQDIVEKILIENGHAKTAKAYILYREQHAKIRETKSSFVDVEQTIGSYINQEDWRVKENSNEQYSFSGLLLYAAGKVMANYNLTQMYTPAIAEAHKKGYFHIHDLSHGVIGYCSGWSLKNLLVRGFGGIPNKVDCKPSKHLSTVVHQMVNYIGCLQMEFAGAQAFSSVDTYIAPFVKAEKLDYKAVKQNMQQLVFSLNIPSRWGCFSEDTEILTKEGWRKGTELEVGDVIATFNPKTEEIEYLPVLKMTKDHYNGKMMRLKNRITDQLVTPNHRVLRRVHNYKEGVSESKYVFEEAGSLKTKMPLIPLAGTFRGEEMDRDTVNLLSWIVSEGSLCENERIAIHQSAEMNPANCADIRGTLGNLGMGFDEQMKVSGYTGKRNCLRFRLSRPDSNRLYRQFFPDYRKNVPAAVRSLSIEQARKFLDTYMKADGWAPENKIYTKKKEDADVFQEMAVKAGWGSTCLLNKNGIYVVRLIKHDYTCVDKIGRLDYDGMVWCPTTKNGTVVVRRKGKVFISGNSQYPFSNLTFDWTVPEDLKDEPAIVGGKNQDFTYGDCQKEMDTINKAFLEVMLEGDANGRIFSFPIPTYNVTKDFDWDSENAQLLFELTAKYGTPYFQNYVGSDLDPGAVRAMCCRLNINQHELMNRPGNMWGPGDNTGSIGVITINMNRLGYEAKSEDEFFEKLRHYMFLAKDALEIKRKVVNKNLENGLMPYTRAYLGTFNNHFSTIGLCGMNEACMNFLKKDISTQDGKAFTIKVLNFMREMTRQFQMETGSLYNLEATPAESAAYRLAKLDRQMYPDIITAGESEPYLTNSTQLPVGYTDDLVKALEHQNDIQPLYTGGTIFHTFLGERLTDGQAARTLVKKIAFNTKLPYFSITPTFSVCKTHGYQKGEVQNCPTCGQENEIYTRIVGYFRPIKNWNAGKQEEYKDRREFAERKALEKPLKCAS